MRVIIVDDEPLGRERVRVFVEKEPDLEIVAEADRGSTAVEKIRELQPDLVFLDIQMPDLDGFGTLNALKESGDALPMVIFVTAYDQHAVQAFEVNAIDYLLKPVQKARFNAAVERVRALRRSAEPNALEARLEALLNGVSSGGDRLRRLEVRSQGRVDYIDVSAIQWLEADGNYVLVHTGNGSPQMARITLSELEKQLDPDRFYRVSRGALVALDQIQSIQTEGRHEKRAVLACGDLVPVTRDVHELQQRLRFGGSGGHQS